MIKVLTNVMDTTRQSIIPLLLVAAIAIPTVTIAQDNNADDVLFVSDSVTDAINIPFVLSGESDEEEHPTIPGAKYRPAADAADPDPIYQNVTIIRNDYAVTGGNFGEAEGTNLALLGDLFPYCSVFWSASGPHEPLGLFPDRITNGDFEDISGTYPTLPGWTIDSPVVWDFDFNMPPSNGASSGAGFVDLTDSGQISQLLTTEPGQTYMLSIDRKGDGSIVSLNGSYLSLTSGEASGDWTTYTATFTAPTTMTSLVIMGTSAGLNAVDNVRFAPYPQTPGLGADGGLHEDADVIANLDYYVRNGGFLFVTGHDAITHPPSAPAVSDGPLVGLLGGAFATAGQQVDPSLTGVSSVATPVTLPPIAGTPSGGGVNQVDGVREQDYLAGTDTDTTLLVTGPGGAYWTVRSPYGDGIDDDGTPDGVDLIDGHIAYVANGVFYYDTDPVDEFGAPIDTPPLSDGEDPSWLAAPHRTALLNFATNSCASAAAAETPTADDQAVSTFVNTPVDIPITGFDPNGDSLTYTIISGPTQGVLDTTAGSVPDTVEYTPNTDFIGNDSFSFTVSDGTHTSPPATVSIEVLPIPPLTVDAGPDVLIDEGSVTPFASAGSFIDPDGCCWTATVNYGEPGGVDEVLPLVGQTFSLGNTYPTDDDAVFLVTVTVTSDSDTDTDTAAVLINNVPPTVDAGPDGSINEGGTFVSPGSFTDPGTLDTHTATVDYGDGGGPQPLTPLTGKAFELSHAYAVAGDYIITVAVTDDDGGIGVDTVAVTVVENAAPVLAPIGNQVVDELSLLTFTASATDADIPADVLTFSLDVGAPAGASIDPVTGLFSWTPNEAQGPGVYPVTVRVTDDAVPNLDDFETFDITVNEVNVAPVLDPIGNQIVDEGSLLSFTATAIDADVPANTLTFSLAGAVPAGAGITAGGMFSWTPSEAQGAGTYTFDVIVMDDGTPNLSDSETISIQVFEVNTAPVLDPIPNQTVDEDTLLSFTATASDVDIPANTLTFSLAGPVPAGASITAGGSFTWTPSEAQGPGTYLFDVIVTDDGTPSSISAQTISIEVLEVNTAPVLDPIGNKSVDEGSLLSFTATASDADIPANTLTFSLAGAVPAGASITAGGEFSWTPSEAQGPGTYTFDVVVTDDGTPNLSDTETISIEVFEVNVAPVLGPIGNRVVNELNTLSLAATATDADVPANTLTFSLAGAVPAGASISAGGVFNWTPTEAQGPGIYTFDVVVTDDGTPNLSDTETISITVNEVNMAPVLGAIGNKVVDELTTLSFTATATDGDIPPNVLTFSLDAGAPAGAAIDPVTGVFSWTPTEAQGPGMFTVTVRVTDNGLPNLSDAESITIDVNEVNQPPVVTVSLASQTVDYSDDITDVTITATDGDLPASTITFMATGVPTNLGTSGSCVQDSSTGTSCTWTLSGTVDEPASTRVVTFSVSDGDVTVSPTTEVIVESEDATATLDDGNATAVMVASDGGNSGPFSLTVMTRETLPDHAHAGTARAGDITRAIVTIDLVPVGPGSAIGGACTSTTMGTTGYDQYLETVCSFDDVPVNTYSVVAKVNGDGYYVGATEGVFTVYDPSLGFTTGGGWFYWPGTDDKTNFGYTMKYGKNGRNVKGSLLVIRHMADGTKYRFKSNALEGLAVGQSLSPDFGWASFSGKGTYLEPGWPDPIGNHKFTVYVEDHGEPGTGADRFWIETRDKDGDVLPGLTIGPNATGDAEIIDGGNIVVPHASGGGKKK